MVSFDEVSLNPGCGPTLAVSRAPLNAIPLHQSHLARWRLWCLGEVVALVQVIGGVRHELTQCMRMLQLLWVF